MQEETIQAPELARAEARLPRWMMAWAFVGALAALLGGYVRVAAAFALGASLAILNYYWLHQAVETLFSLSRPRVPKRSMLKFLIRYPLAFAGVYVFYHTGWLPFLAILAGLFVPVVAVLIEAIIQIREGLRKTEGSRQ